MMPSKQLSFCVRCQIPVGHGVEKVRLLDRISERRVGTQVIVDHLQL